MLPLAVILLKEPLGNLLKGLGARPEEGMGAYLTVAPFELFEVVLSFSPTRCPSSAWAASCSATRA